jgi:hypothetical protein
MHRSLLSLVSVSLLAAGALHAQTLVLSDFSSFNPAAEQYLAPSFGGGQWSPDTAQDNGDGTFTIGDFGLGTPGGEGGNGFALSIAGLPAWITNAVVELTGFAGVTNATPFLGFYLEDAMDPFVNAVTIFDLSGFAGGSTTVSLPLNLGGLDPANIGRWGVITGEFDNPDFHFTFDHLQLTAIPEPATYAAMLAALALGVAVWRRRQASAG